MDSLPLEVALTIADMTADEVKSKGMAGGAYYNKGYTYGADTAVKQVKKLVTPMFRDRKLVKRDSIVEAISSYMSMPHPYKTPILWHLRIHLLMLFGKYHDAGVMAEGYANGYRGTIAAVLDAYTQD